MNEESLAEVVVRDDERLQPMPPTPEVLPGRPSVNYRDAVDLGRVLAASGLYPDYRDAAKAAVVVMIGLDLGISPTAALQGIHHFESDGKTVFLTEGRILAALIKARPGCDYRFKVRTEEEVTIEFLREGKLLKPPITWDMDRAKQAGLYSKKGDMYRKHPVEMLTWRALAEGTRIHFPEVLAGQPVYVPEEFPEAAGQDSLAEALDPGPKALDTPEAEAVREEIAAAYDQLVALNAKRLVPGRYARMIAQADHSLERLKSVHATIVDLAATEREVQELIGEAGEKLTKAQLKLVLAQVERASGNRERIELLREALEEEAK